MRPSAGEHRSAFPVTRGALTLACLGIEEGPDGPLGRFELRVVEDGAPVSVVEQPVALAALEVDDADALAARAAERMADPRFASGLVMPAQLLAPPFRRVPASALEGAADVPYALHDQLRAQADAGGFEARFDRLDLWPVEARTVYFLVLADAMIGGNGLESFLGQQALEDVLGVLEALEETGCERLARRLREGIMLCAEEGGAEFLMQVDEDWIEEHGLPVPEGEGRPWSRIDSWNEGGTWWLLRHEVAPALAAYVAAHRAALIT